VCVCVCVCVCVLRHCAALTPLLLFAVDSIAAESKQDPSARLRTPPATTRMATARGTLTNASAVFASVGVRVGLHAVWRLASGVWRIAYSFWHVACSV
jgi:hypothetical protein